MNQTILSSLVGLLIPDLGKIVCTFLDDPETMFVFLTNAQARLLDTPSARRLGPPQPGGRGRPRRWGQCAKGW